MSGRTAASRPDTTGGMLVPYRLDEQAGFLLRKANQRHLAIFARAIPDLTPPQFAALARLAAAGAMSQSHLGQSIAMDAATVKGVIDRLRMRGLVEIAADGADRRRLVVSLTSLGRDLFETLAPMARGITAETLSPLTPDEAETLVMLLSRIG